MAKKTGGTSKSDQLRAMREAKYEEAEKRRKEEAKKKGTGVK
jgi:hypothetical protein